MPLSATKPHSRALPCYVLARKANQRLVLCIPVKAGTILIYHNIHWHDMISIPSVQLSIRQVKVHVCFYCACSEQLPRGVVQTLTASWLCTMAANARARGSPFQLPLLLKFRLPFLCSFLFFALCFFSGSCFPFSFSFSLFHFPNLFLLSLLLFLFTLLFYNSFAVCYSFFCFSFSSNIAIASALMRTHGPLDFWALHFGVAVRFAWVGEKFSDLSENSLSCALGNRFLCVHPLYEIFILL